MISTFHPSKLFDTVVVLRGKTVINDTFLSCTVVHQLVPRLSGCHSEQCYDGIMEVLKVSVDADSSILLDTREDSNSKDRVHKQEEEEKPTYIGKLLNSSNESIEKDS